MLSTSGGGQRPGQDSRQGLVTKKVASEQTGREQGKVGAGGGCGRGRGESGAEGPVGSWVPFCAKHGTTKKGCDLTWAFTRPLKTTVAGAQGAQAMVRPWGPVGGPLWGRGVGGATVRPWELGGTLRAVGTWGSTVRD